MKCALYARVACSQKTVNGMDLGIESQITRMQDYCKSKGFKDVAIFEDCAYSGNDTNRPSLKRLIASMEKDEIKMVIVTDLNRLGRNLGNMEGLLNKFYVNGVTIISLSENLTILPHELYENFSSVNSLMNLLHRT
ncbi:MAG: recombinase family protein [Nitrospirae bacterium]|nr:recombinase family protein [Nitrospirota bacterium]